MKKLKANIIPLILLIYILLLASCSCVECTYIKTKSSIVTFASSFFTPSKKELIVLTRNFAIKNPNVDWSFLALYSKNKSIDDLMNLQIVKLDTVLIEEIGWYEKFQETYYWTVKVKLKGDYSINPEVKTDSNVGSFKKTLVLFLYKNLSEKWVITHTRHKLKPGTKLTPIYKANSMFFKLTIPSTGFAGSGRNSPRVVWC